MQEQGGNSVLIGVLADVSLSMRDSIGSSGDAAINRLDAFSEALERTVRQAAETLRNAKASRTRVHLFAYGFGFGNILSQFLNGGGDPVRDLLAPGGKGQHTVEIKRLADNWEDYYANIRMMGMSMFGNTPMRQALEMARDRIEADKAESDEISILFILSDGDPTDGTTSEIQAIAKEIRRAGTIIVSCYVTGSDITQPRHLYGKPRNNWPSAAKLMFDCASKLPADASFRAHFEEFKWQLDDQAKLFAQVNQSEMLREFLDVVLSPIDSGAPSRSSPEPAALTGPATVAKTAETEPLAAVTADEKQPKPDPVVPNHSPLVPVADSKELLLFVHGLGGSGKETWGDLPRFLESDPFVSEKYAIHYYTFPTSLFRVPFVSSKVPKIQELAAGLRTEIEHCGFDRVNLVCHSLGGLIARRYLIEEVKAGRALRVPRLALLAVPHNGAGLASVAKFVAWKHNQIQQLCKDADLIEMLNEDWFTFKIQEKVRTKFVMGTQDQVVDRFSVAGYWGNPDVETVVGRGHMDLVKPQEPNDLIVRILTRFLTT